jgi:hypothetical protein
MAAVMRVATSIFASDTGKRDSNSNQHHLSHVANTDNESYILGRPPLLLILKILKNEFYVLKLWPFSDQQNTYDYSFGHSTKMFVHF